MNREILEQPFPESLIKNRKGPFGQMLSYVEGIEYVKRLNDAFDAQWSFEIVEHHIRDTEVIVVGKLVAGNIVKMAFGGSSITFNRETGEIVNLADDLKSGATDSLKKACSLLGIGSHLYGADIQSAQPERKGKGNGNNHAQRKSNGNGNGGNGHNGNRLTQKQLSAIWSIGRSLGYSADEIREQSIERFSAIPEQLSKSDASTFIGEFNEAIGNNTNGAS